MKSLKQLTVIGIFGALACAGLHAQTVNMRATIPFDFNVGRATLPAGDYEIQEQGAVVLVRRIDAGKAANAYVQTLGASAASVGSPHLEFHRYEGEYFLSAIWNGSFGSGRQVPQSNREKDAAKRLGNSVEASVMATKR
jgi:hypothetical protein